MRECVALLEAEFVITNTSSITYLRYACQHRKKDDEEDRGKLSEDHHRVIVLRTASLVLLLPSCVMPTSLVESASPEKHSENLLRVDFIFISLTPSTVPRAAIPLRVCVAARFVSRHVIVLAFFSVG